MQLNLSFGYFALIITACLLPLFPQCTTSSYVDDRQFYTEWLSSRSKRSPQVDIEFTGREEASGGRKKIWFPVWDDARGELGDQPLGQEQQEQQK